MFYSDLVQTTNQLRPNAKMNTAQTPMANLQKDDVTPNAVSKQYISRLASYSLQPSK